MMKRNEVYQEDINSMTGHMIDCILGEEFNIDLSDEEQDELWDAIIPGLERFFHYPNYRSYN